MITKIYKGFVFNKMYRQWVNKDIGGFKKWTEVKSYIDRKGIKK